MTKSNDTRDDNDLRVLLLISMRITLNSTTLLLKRRIHYSLFSINKNELLLTTHEIIRFKNLTQIVIRIINFLKFVSILF